VRRPSIRQKCNSLDRRGLQMVALRAFHLLAGAKVINQDGAQLALRRIDVMSKASSSKALLHLVIPCRCCPRATR